MDSSKILIIYAVIFAAVTILRLFFAQTFVGRVAFSWMGPIPKENERWSKYQLRWAIYSLDWLAQIAVLFVIVNGVLVVFPSTHEYQLLWALQFALALGGAMAIVASVAFLVKCAKARFIGPDPAYEPLPQMEEHG